jgi:CRISPR type I-E-associated protein CasB/Cse2
MTDSGMADKKVPSASFDVGAEARKWWQRYCHPRDGDAASRARLRRARSPQEALLVPAAVVLARRLRVGKDLPDEQAWRLTQALNLARVLSHITDDDDRQPMEAAGWKSFPDDPATAKDQPILSEPRFRRLIQAERGGEEQVTAFTRLIQLLNGKMNVASIASDFTFWNDRIVKRWTFRYYAAGIATPDEPSTAAVPLTASKEHLA